MTEFLSCRPNLEVDNLTTPAVNATTAAYIAVTGIDDLHEQCAARGARIVTGLADHPWGLRDFVVEMPGGHRLALGERIAPPR